MRFNWDQLPSKPFSLEEEEPLQKPLTEISFSFENLKEVPLTIELEMDSIKSTIFPLPEPIISQVGTMEKSDRTKAGILGLTDAQGLPGKSIKAQIIGPDGTHWIGTELGLVKFIGSEFHLYEIVITEFSSGVTNIIVDLDYDPQGRLVITTLENGFMILDPETELVENFEIPLGFTRGAVDQDGNYWGGRIGDSPKFIDLKNRTLSSLVFDSELRLAFSTVSLDSKNNLWIPMSSEIAIVNPERTSVKLLGIDEGLEGDFFHITEAPDGSVWLTTFERGATNVSLEKGIISILGEEQGYSGGSLDVNIDSRGQVWFGYTNGFTIYNPSKSTIKSLQTNSIKTGSGAPSMSLFDHMNEVYWESTYSSGVQLYDPLGMDSRHLSSNDGLINDNVWGIEEDKEHRVWLATYGGLNIYDPSTKTIKYLEIPRQNGANDHRGISKISEDIFFIGSAGGFSLLNLKESTITSYQGSAETARFFWRARLHEDGSMWIGTNDGLLVFDQEEGTMKKLDEYSGLASSTVWGLEKDHLGKFWIVTNTGINYIDPEKNTVTFIGTIEGLSTADQSVIIRSSEDGMIIGGARGISIINKDRNQVINVNGDHGLQPESLYDMVESQGRIQLGTSNGIAIIEKPSQENPNQAWRFMNYGRAEGFPYTDYNQMTAKVTSDGKVWWGAAPVLTVNLNDPRFENETTPTIEITGIRIMDQGAHLFAKYESSLFLSKLDSLPQDLESARNYLAKNNIKWDSLDRNSKIPLGLVLPYDQNSITFTFSNPAIKSRDEIEYRYILEGADEEWSEITKAPVSKTYFNLLQGDYSFKVITKGFNGNWSEPSTYSFRINPPWWFTWWAFLIYAAFLALVIYTIVQVRSYYLKKENRILEERVNHRTAQLNKSIEDLKSTQEQLIQSEKMASLGELTAGIAHEIQNPLNFVNNFSEVSEELLEEMNEEIENGNLDEVKGIAQELKKNLSKINHHGKRADSIVKGMLEHSRSSSGEKIETDLNALADEFVRLSYHGLRAKDKSFNADFVLELGSNLPKIKVAPQDIGRVILNLVNNAFYAVNTKAKKGINGYQPTVIVGTKQSENGVELFVRDNGNGIPDSVRDKIFQPFFTTKPAGSGTGLGLSLSYDIIKAHGGELKVESKEGEGTTFYIYLKTSE
ncbi:ATP-binding protein [Algoriphagus sp. CAU 1675]|uniref:ATP-binding protein n=1 Tax=Algoriphagus sp. CAU 1675 TaxID=3032597 RepID=UPI0023DAB88A|nr:ATP-binding protein [Algoriphagus sp. CAU 1675]MDF2156744.1 ATP-binding protein [Algoriphagus sp. CAU 1675]